MEKVKNGKFKDKNVLVVGLARSGTGAANLLSAIGARVSVTDKRPREFLADNLKRLSPSINVIAGEHPGEVFNTVDLIVVSPGVPLDIPPLLDARDRGVQIIGELELAYQIITGDELRVTGYSSPAFIGVTGTNGKSTTTTLIDRMLQKSGFKTLLGGNIGSALTEELNKVKVRNEELKVDYIVAEISSFQLESIQDFRPFIAVILNITPDHLDRYKEMQEYIRAKGKIFENQGPGDYLILNADDSRVMELYNFRFRIPDSRLRDMRILFFSRKNEVEGIYYKDARLHCKLHSTSRTAPPAFLPASATPVARRGSRRKQEKGAVSSPFEIISVDEIRIKGVHNVENAMAASLVAIVSGCPIEAIKSVLNDFSGLEHRLEFVREIDKVSFINDSKGTNIGAVAKSLESFRNVILIMGGRDKEGDFTQLNDLIKEKVKALILFGEAREKIAGAVGEAAKVNFVRNLKEAVEVSMSKSSAGDVVLLSPGCTSFDMFANFEERGTRFKEAVWAIS